MAKKKDKKRQIKQYDHSDKDRVNNPPVGLVNESRDPSYGGKKTYAYDPHIDPSLQFDQNSTRAEIERIIDEGLASGNIDEVKLALEELKKRQEPYLNWAGKAENTSFEVPTVSLHVHERIDPMRIIKEVKKKNGEPGIQGSLFEQEKRDLREAVEFYQHKDNWSNRLIAGDSLLVMSSLLEKEDMGGKIQMIFFDPPYGIKYGSNFMPFINKRDVKDGNDQDLSAEPEMLKAFRDTWDLGIHSYLTYVRDRVLLSHKLLSDTGSLWFQISEENLSLVKSVLDEIFGRENFVVKIVFTKTGSHSGDYIEPINDYLLWYVKDKNKGKEKVNKLFEKREWSPKNTGGFNYYEQNDEIVDARQEPPNDLNKLFRGDPMLSSGHRETTSCEIELDGEIFDSGYNYNWKVSSEGVKRLDKLNRLIKKNGKLSYKRFFGDFPLKHISNLWSGFGGASNMEYVVQTNEKILQRCIAISTHPGDLVFDPTCGSGTTAKISEKLGRRWITCDSSRIALQIAKKRMISSLYDYYKLVNLDGSVSGGFAYKTAPHIMMSDLANEKLAKTEILYDDPIKDTTKIRVSAPFTVESVPAASVKSIEESENSHNPKDISVSKTGETLRQDEWQQELLRTGVRVKGGAKIEFNRIETSIGTKYIQAIGETITALINEDKVEQPKRVFIIFGKEHAPMEQRQVELALDEAETMRPKPDIILFAAFQFDEEAAKDIDETNFGKIQLLKVQMNMDLQTADLKKKQSSNESFWLIGAPDVEIRDSNEVGQMVVEVKGFDYYDPRKGEVNSGTSKNIAMWMLDPDYDGRSIFPTQIFFPMSGTKDGWSKLAKTLKAEIDEDKIEAFRGTTSLPFKAGEQVAVKIIDDRGIESLKILRP